MSNHKSARLNKRISESGQLNLFRLYTIFEEVLNNSAHGSVPSVMKIPSTTQSDTFKEIIETNRRMDEIQAEIEQHERAKASLERARKAYEDEMLKCRQLYEGHSSTIANGHQRSSNSSTKNSD